MKVLGIVCSPRKQGNTEILMGEALAGAREAGADVEMVTIAGKNIAPCDGCKACEKTSKCKIQDDMQAIYTKLLEADGIILGTPVYFWNVSAQAKTIIDRTYALKWRLLLRGKVGGVIAVQGRAGAGNAFSAIHDFFNIQRVVPAGTIGYTREEEINRQERGGGALAFGSDEKGTVKQDKRGMFEARALGKAMVKAIKTLSSSHVS